MNAHEFARVQQALRLAEAWQALHEERAAQAAATFGPLKQAYHEIEAGRWRRVAAVLRGETVIDQDIGSESA